jgi:hypothetical protein
MYKHNQQQPQQQVQQQKEKHIQQRSEQPRQQHMEQLHMPCNGFDKFLPPAN